MDFGSQAGKDCLFILKLSKMLHRVNIYPERGHELLPEEKGLLEFTMTCGSDAFTDPSINLLYRSKDPVFLH